MPPDPNCLFCRLVAEGDHVHAADGFVAIRDIAPAAETHLLVLPERHIDTFRDIAAFPDEEAARMLRFIAEVAAAEGLEDYRVIVNIGPRAGQTVFHLHWHVLAGDALPRVSLEARDRSSRQEIRQTVRVELIATIESELKEARLARDDERRDALALILASLRAAEKELQRPLSEDEELQVLQRERKKRVEAFEAFEAAGREEQADKEDFELEVLEEFMPEPLSEDELDEIVDDVIAEVGATSLRDIGRVMADVMPRVSGKADGSAVSQIVREKLA